jgi:hypothetical protein
MRTVIVLVLTRVTNLEQLSRSSAHSSRGTWSTAEIRSASATSDSSVFLLHSNISVYAYIYEHEY